MNKTINGKQCTVLWHVDDLKISHIDHNVVTDVISQLEAEFGVEAPLTIMCGKVHNYLGMVLDYTVDGKIQIKMDNYVATVLEEAPLDMKGESATPAAAHLFEVNQTNATLLDAETADKFHHIVAKLLFFFKQA